MVEEKHWSLLCCGFNELRHHFLDERAPDIGGKTHRAGFRSGSTANRYLAVLSHLFTMAMEWRTCTYNPVRDIRKFPENKSGRVLGLEEIERLKISCGLSRNGDLSLIFSLAISTGMRRGEILNLKRPQHSFRRRTHLLFVSMVDAPQDGRPCRAVTPAEKEREFNVAASRAREQMILFHSAGLQELKETCLQYKLLNHCLNPSVEQLPVADMTLSDLRETAHKAERVLGNQPAPFDSWFEVDVFLEIASRGYQLIPQYTVNPNDNTYRIDMVVIGMNGKLAIERDGDHWHGPAEYERDMARQRELERCGWEFWRVTRWIILP